MAAKWEILLGVSSENFRAGQAVGDVASIVIGGIEAAVGGSITSGGTAATVTVVGAPVGVPAIAAGGALTAHGAAGSVGGIVHMSAASEGGGTTGDWVMPRHAPAPESWDSEKRRTRLSTLMASPFSKVVIPTSDRDAHKGGVWKVFDRKGNRIGTFNADLTIRVGK